MSAVACHDVPGARRSGCPCKKFVVYNGSLVVLSVYGLAHPP